MNMRELIQEASVVWAAAQDAAAANDPNIICDYVLSLVTITDIETAAEVLTMALYALAVGLENLHDSEPA